MVTSGSFNAPSASHAVDVCAATGDAKTALRFGFNKYDTTYAVNATSPYDPMALGDMALSVPSQRRFRELVYALTKHFRAAGVTPLMTMEVAELLGAAQLTGHGVSSTADNLILLRYVEMDGRLERAVSVLKARGTGHASELRRFLIDGRGAHVGERFEDLRGVLTGVPQPARAAERPVARRASGTRSRGR